MSAVYTARVDAAELEGALSPADGPLPAELACLSPLAVPTRRLDFALGRTAAHRAIRALGHPVVPVLVGPGRAPVWPPALIGSISHAGGTAVAAVAWRRDVAALGVDLEVIRPLAPGTVDIIADPAERAWIGQDIARAIWLFSAKESIFKALYPLHGAIFDFDAVHLDPCCPPPTEALARPLFTVTLRQPLGPYVAGARLTVSGASIHIGGAPAVYTSIAVEADLASVWTG